MIHGVGQALLFIMTMAVFSIWEVVANGILPGMNTILVVVAIFFSIVIIYQAYMAKKQKGWIYFHGGITPFEMVAHIATLISGVVLVFGIMFFILYLLGTDYLTSNKVIADYMFIVAGAGAPMALMEVIGR
jgi:hypothetical protein